MNIQDKFTEKNYIYKITSVINLNGGTLDIPQDCILDFQGGKIINGTINLNNTLILPLGIQKSQVIDCSTTGSFRDGQIFYNPNLNSLLLYQNNIQSQIKPLKSTTITIQANATETINWVKQETIQIQELVKVGISGIVSLSWGDIELLASEKFKNHIFIEKVENQSAFTIKNKFNEPLTITISTL